MPYLGKQTVEVACPRCGEKQPQPRRAYSTVCKACHEHFRVQEVLHPAPKAAKTEIELRRVCCFQCGTENHVPRTAASSMCKRCSSHIDLTNYEITMTVSKNIRTYGRLVITEKGYLLNTEALVQDAVIKGRLIGRLNARNSLEIHSSAIIKGTFTAGRLILPAGQHFNWPEPLRTHDAEISGELAATLHATGLVRLKSTARCFGDVHAVNLVIEAGAVFVGSARVGQIASQPSELYSCQKSSSTSGSLRVRAFPVEEGGASLACH